MGVALCLCVFKDNVLYYPGTPLTFHLGPAHLILTPLPFLSIIYYLFLLFSSKYSVILYSPLSPLCCLLPLFSFQISLLSPLPFAPN